MSQVIRVKADRASTSKVRTGCTTCKRRHVKCDEAKPTCNRCLKAGKNCQGYIKPPEIGKFDNIRKIIFYGPQMSLSDEPMLNWRELRALAHFRESTASDFAGPFSSKLWSIDMMRLAQYEPSVKYALVAVSTMHEYHTQRTQPHADLLVFAMSQYGQALKEIMAIQQFHHEKSLDAAMIACLLMSVFESLQGNFHASLSHGASGIRILAEEQRRLPTPHQSLIPREALTQLFTGIDKQIMEIGDPTFNGTLIPLKQPSVEGSPVFSCYEEASSLLEALINELLHYGQQWDLYKLGEPAVEHDMSYLLLIFESFTQRFHLWTTAFESLVEGDVCSTPSNTQAMLILRINQVVVQIILESVFTGFDARFDQLPDKVELILLLVEQFLSTSSKSMRCSPSFNSYDASLQPTFTMSLGILPALFMIGCHCHVTKLRNKALYYLKICNRREGVWDSQLVSRVVERIISIETLTDLVSQTLDVENSELSLSNGGNCMPIRVRNLQASFAPGRVGKISYTVEFSSPEEIEATKDVKETITW